MCLYKTHLFPKRSNNPIKVYKNVIIVNGKYRTPFIDLEVNIGDTIKAKKHWFWGIFKTTIKSEGVHANRIPMSISTNFVSSWAEVVIIEAEIPPHVPYWIGKDGDIAASKIKLIKVI